MKSAGEITGRLLLIAFSKMRFFGKFSYEWFLVTYGKLSLKFLNKLSKTL
jgi:hypothetical protein